MEARKEEEEEEKLKAMRGHSKSQKGKGHRDGQSHSKQELCRALKVQVLCWPEPARSTHQRQEWPDLSGDLKLRDQ